MDKICSERKGEREKERNDRLLTNAISNAFCKSNIVDFIYTRTRPRLILRSDNVDLFFLYSPKAKSVVTVIK